MCKAHLDDKYRCKSNTLFYKSVMEAWSTHLIEIPFIKINVHIMCQLF